MWDIYDAHMCGIYTIDCAVFLCAVFLNLDDYMWESATYWYTPFSPIKCQMCENSLLHVTTPQKITIQEKLKKRFITIIFLQKSIRDSTRDKYPNCMRSAGFYDHPSTTKNTPCSHFDTKDEELDYLARNEGDL